MSDSDVECLLIDARKDMQSAKSLVKFIEATSNSIPLIVIATEGSLSAISADWGMSDVVLDTAGPAEVEARIRIVCGRKPISQNLNSDSGKEIRSGAISIDEVEPVSSIVKRFATGAMSFGSISQEARLPFLLSEAPV